MRIVIYKEKDHKDLEALINNTRLSSDEAIVDVDIQPITEYKYTANSNLNIIMEARETILLATVYIEEESI